MVVLLGSLQTDVQRNCMKLTECLRVEKTHYLSPSQQEGRQPPNITQRLFFQGLTGTK